MSSDVDSRAQASEIYSEDLGDAESHAINVELLREAMFAAKLLAYAQGFSLMRAASEKYGWNLDFAGIAKIWRNGCIIRSDFLNNIALAYENGSPRNMIFAPYFQSRVKLLVPSLRRACAFCALEGVPAPCLSSALSYFDSLRQISSPANLVQGLRDFFGAHTYERVDKPRGEFFHTDWRPPLPRAPRFPRGKSRREPYGKSVRSGTGNIRGFGGSRQAQAPARAVCAALRRISAGELRDNRGGADGDGLRRVQEVPRR